MCIRDSLPPDPNGKIGVRGTVTDDAGQSVDLTVFTIGGPFNHPESDSGPTRANGAYGPLHVPPNQTVEVVPSFPFPLARDPIPIGTTPLEYNLVVAPGARLEACLLYTSPSPRDRTRSRMPSSA